MKHLLQNRKGIFHIDIIKKHKEELEKIGFEFNENNKGVLPHDWTIIANEMIQYI